MKHFALNKSLIPLCILGTLVTKITCSSLISGKKLSLSEPSNEDSSEFQLGSLSTSSHFPRKNLSSSLVDVREGVVEDSDGTLVDGDDDMVKRGGSSDISEALLAQKTQDIFNSENFQSTYKKLIKLFEMETKILIARTLNDNAKTTTKNTASSKTKPKRHPHKPFDIQKYLKDKENSFWDSDLPTSESAVTPGKGPAKKRELLPGKSSLLNRRDSKRKPSHKRDKKCGDEVKKKYLSCISLSEQAIRDLEDKLTDNME